MVTASSATQTQTDPRVTQMLAATAMGVYLLVIVGATTAILDGAAACPTWPTCNGSWLVPLDDAALLVAWGHRVVTLFVGLLLLVTVGVAWVRNISGRVRGALGLAAVLYPLQVGLGALTAITRAPTVLTALHLTTAMAIFSGLLVALLWHLEDETGTVPTHAGRARSDVGESQTDPGDVAAAQDAVEHGGTGVTPHARAYLTLVKPKLMWLLSLVALAAMGLAAGPELDLGTVVATLSGGVLAIGASGTFNNVLERDVDRHMERTADRPLVNGVIPVRRAITFGMVLTMASVGVFVTFVNVLAAALGLLAILFYSVIYTLILKPHTTQNIVIGGAVGAFPALIGWAAVTNTVEMPALVLGGVIFLWTPAHFYNLALAYKEDYERAGLPMLPVVRGEAVTRRHILLYFGATMLGASVLGAANQLGWTYAATVVVFGAVFLWAIIQLYYKQTDHAAFRTFVVSNVYLGALLVAIVVDTLIM